MLDLPLHSLHRPAAAQIAEPWLLVLMHGVGSNEQDMFGLAPYIPETIHVVSLRAPYRMGPNANAWFEFGVNPDGSRTIDEEQEIASRALVVQTVEALTRQLNVPASRVIVGGFSQGGIMSLSVLLTKPELVAGAMALHSRLLPEVLSQIAPASAFAGKQLWVSQGLQDNVIPVANGHFIVKQVEPLGLNLTYREFEGAHEIRPQELTALVAWLQQLKPVSA